MILLVDDEEVLRMVTRDYLELKRFAVTAVADVRTAYIALEELGERIDLLIADHQLPDGTGWHVVARARERKPDLPVIYISGYADLPMPDDVDVDPGSVTFLAKPFEMRDLTDEIARAIGT